MVRIGTHRALLGHLLNGSRGAHRIGIPFDPLQIRQGQSAEEEAKKRGLALETKATPILRKRTKSTLSDEAHI